MAQTLPGKGEWKGGSQGEQWMRTVEKQLLMQQELCCKSTRQGSDAWCGMIGNVTLLAPGLSADAPPWPWAMKISYSEASQVKHPVSNNVLVYTQLKTSPSLDMCTILFKDLSTRMHTIHTETDVWYVRSWKYLRIYCSSLEVATDFIHDLDTGSLDNLASSSPYLSILFHRVAPRDSEKWHWSTNTQRFLNICRTQTAIYRMRNMPQGTTYAYKW